MNTSTTKKKQNIGLKSLCSSGFYMIAHADDVNGFAAPLK
jgi:hypothetical protein